MVWVLALVRRAGRCGPRVRLWADRCRRAAHRSRCLRIFSLPLLGPYSGRAYDIGQSDLKVRLAYPMHRCVRIRLPQLLFSRAKQSDNFSKVTSVASGVTPPIKTTSIHFMGFPGAILPTNVEWTRLVPMQPDACGPFGSRRAQRLELGRSRPKADLKAA